MSKPSLLKPGAELLARLFNLVADTQIVSSAERVDHEIPYSYDAECRLFNRYGAFVGNGIGCCNSAEPQYAFRWVFQEELPRDIRSVEELRTRKLNERTQYRVPMSRNEVFGLANSVKKKAKKRAFVDAVLTVTGSSRLFSQDVGDGGEEPEKGEKEGGARSAGGGKAH